MALVLVGDAPVVVERHVITSYSIHYTKLYDGTPKGALIEHRSVVRLVKNTNYIRNNFV